MFIAIACTCLYYLSLLHVFTLLHFLRTGFIISNNNNNIIMAGITVFERGWLPHGGEAQMAYNYRFPTRTTFGK